MCVVRSIYKTEKISHKENLTESGYTNLADFEFYNPPKFCNHEKVPFVWLLVIASLMYLQTLSIFDSFNNAQIPIKFSKVILYK